MRRARAQPARTSLTRYLGYWGELLARIGKRSVLLVQGFDDSDTLLPVNEIEDLSPRWTKRSLRCEDGAAKQAWWNEPIVAAVPLDTRAGDGARVPRMRHRRCSASILGWARWLR